MAISKKTISKTLKAQRSQVPGAFTVDQANPFSLILTLADGELFDGAQNVYCEFHGAQYPTTDPPLANVVIASPTTGVATFDFTSAQMNQTLTSAERALWMVAFATWADGRIEVLWRANVTMNAHHASALAASPPVPTLGITMQDADARYRLQGVDIAQSSITGLAASLALKAPLTAPTFEGAVIIGTGAGGVDSLTVGVNTPTTFNGLTTWADSATFAYADGTVAGFHRAALGFQTLSNYVTLTGSQTLTNKIYDGVAVKTLLTVNNPANTFAYTVTPAAIAANRVLNLPLITATDTLAVLGLAQTFAAVQTMTSPVFKTDVKVRNPADTFGYTITPAAIAADRILNLPLITATDTLAALGLSQTWSGTNTFNSQAISATTPIFKTSIFFNNPANTFKYILTPAAIVADRILNLPLIAATDTLAVLGLAQTFTAQQTMTTPLFKTSVVVNNPANTFAYTLTPAAIAGNYALNLPLITGADTLASLGMTQTFTGTNNFTVNSTNVLALYAVNGTSGGSVYSYASGASKYIGINTNGTLHKLFTIGADDLTICTNTSTVAAVFKSTGNVLETKGGRIKPITADVSTAFTLTASMEVATVANAGAVTVNLPVGVLGTTYRITNKGAGTATLTPNGSQKLFTTAQVATLALTTGQSVKIIFDGTDWLVYKSA